MSTLGFIALSAATAFSAARADDDPWEVRLRGVYLDPADKSDAIPGLSPKDAIHIDHKWLPDLDFEYFLTPYWSTELLLTHPQSQTVTVTVTVTVTGTPIGSFKHLPPILSAAAPVSTPCRSNTPRCCLGLYGNAQTCAPLRAHCPWCLRQDFSHASLKRHSLFLGVILRRAGFDGGAET